MATITKKKGKWFVQIRRSFHKPIYKTFVAKPDAYRWSRETERLIEIGQFVDTTESNKTTLRTLLERYEREVVPKKRTTGDKYLISNIMKHSFVDKVLSHITSSDIAEFRDKRLNVVSGSSVNRELSIVSDCIKRAINEWGCYIRENPVKPSLRCEENPSRTRRLEMGEYEKLMTACTKSRAFWCPIIDFAIHSAMRRGELLNARYEDLKNGLLHIPITKTKVPRTIPLTPRALSIINELPRSISGYLIPTSANALRLSWERAKRRANIEDLHFHDLRHEAISRFFEMGLSIPEVALISGHKDYRMLACYTHLRPKDVLAKICLRL